MNETMSIAQISELYRQLGIDPVAAERFGIKGLLPSPPGHIPVGDQRETTITYARVPSIMFAHAQLERNSR